MFNVGRYLEFDDFYMLAFSSKVSNNLGHGNDSNYSKRTPS